MSADTPDVLTACECGHSIDRHHAGTQRGECRTYNCFCTLKPSDVFAAERERADAAELLALAAEIEDGRVQRPGMQRRRRWAERIRAALGGGAS